METVKVAMDNLKGNEYPEEEGSPLNKKNDMFLVCYFFKVFAVNTVSVLPFKIFLYANATGLYTYTHLVNVGSVCFVLFLVWFGLFYFVWNW